MENPVPLSRRIAILAGIFFFILVSGVLSMHIFGGARATLAEDFYLVLTLFGLEGGWVFDGPTNFYLKILVFAAPLFTVLGIIEIFTRKAVTLALQFWNLFWTKGHVVILGLNEDSLLLITSLRRAGKKVTVIDKTPAPGLAIACRKLGVPVIEGDPGGKAELAKARLQDASIAISFVPEIAGAISIVFSAGKLLQEKKKGPIDIWLNIKDAEFGRRIGDYLKFASLSDLVHPRFFNLNEVAARHLVRKYPPDVYADALGQDHLHLAVYGFGNFAFEVIDEFLLQTAGSFPKPPKVTILSENPAKAKAQLLAFCPEMAEVAEISVDHLTVYSTGIAQADYEKIPEDVTAHLVCYRKEETATAVALSLRGLLLSKPTGLKKKTKRRMNAPIFVRLTQRKGIAQLLRSHSIDPSLAGTGKQKRGDIPDGIFAFGIRQDYLSIDQDNALIPTVIDATREKAARFFHLSYLQDRGNLKNITAEVLESSEVLRGWEILGPQYRESCRQVADHIWPKARLIRHRLVPKKGAQADPANLTREEKKRLAVAEHARWMTERQLAGWTYHKKRIDEAKRHNLLRPWEDLSETEATLDMHMADRITAAAGHAGLELRREFVIGVVGHRLSPGRPFDEAHVKKLMKKEFLRVVEKHPGTAPVVLTHLADGADTIAAEVALEMQIPFVVPLPLPFETYRRDFEENGPHHVEKFLDLISLADFYFEIPLRFGDMVGLARENKKGQMSKARTQQYALGGAYIAERADELIAVWDGKKARGIGGTGDVVEWRKHGAIPKEFQSPDFFKKHTKAKPAIIIKPTP